jgi:hypothetical protein
MVPIHEPGSLTKEPPHSRFEATIRLITPGMTMQQLREAAAAEEKRATAAGVPKEERPHTAIPGLLENRFLRVENGVIVYDRLLALVAEHGVESEVVRRAMYLVWAWRDERIRRFVVEQIADKNGRWSAARATDKKRLAFFEEFFGADGAKKSRSNYEFFLVGTGILPSAGGVNLRPVEGWLPEAMLVAAQHEPNAGIRAGMLHDPVGTLFALGLNGLADLTESDRGGIHIEGSGTPEEESDELIPAPPPTGGDTKEWKDRTPGTSPPATSTKTVASNAVALERANSSHLALERILAKVMNAAGQKPLYTSSIDMLCAGSSTVVGEIKSCTARNFHSQVRRGVSQLLEYRWLYRDALPKDVQLMLLVEIEPPHKKRWLIEYAKSLGIALVWKQSGSEILVMEAPVPSYLAKLVTSI